MLLPATDVARAERAARKVLHDLEHPFDADGRPVMVSASIGIAGAPVHASTGDELLKKADSAMYLTKSDQCGCTTFHNADRDQRVYHRVSMATALRLALDQRQLEVDYQPIVHVQSGAVIGIESLVRWNHPEQGRFWQRAVPSWNSPAWCPLTGFVLDRALTEWPLSAMLATCSITVNVSPRSLHHSAFPGRVAELLDLIACLPNR